MKLNINAEQFKTLGQAGIKIGKSIIIEGTKAVVLKAAATAITTSFEEGFGAVKGIKLDEILEGKKKSKNKKFSFKKTEEAVEVEVENTEVTE